jgi:predicted transcriptional regulator
MSETGGSEGVVHARLLDLTLRGYDKSEWMVMRRVWYKGYQFDAVAFNPVSKELEFIEVDVFSETPQDKIRLAESLGKVRVVRAKPVDRKKEKSRLYQLLSAVANTTRLEILQVLEGNPLHYNELVERVGLNATRDAGKFAFHIRKLVGNRLIKREGGARARYILTDNGKRVLDLVRQLDSSPPNER